MDRLDCKILSTLQQDGQISMSRLSEMVGLSLSACHRRVKILETDGKISGYSARIDRQKIGLEIKVYIEVKLVSQRREDIAAFERAISLMDDVLECHMISGEFDYLMLVAAKGTADYEFLYRERLSQIPSVVNMKTLLCLSTVKEFQGYNLENVCTG